MGPNIMPLPDFDPLPISINGKIAIKVGDDISTDHIIPAGAKILPYRSNIEKLSEFCFFNLKPFFKDGCLKNKCSVILAGLNYGQGSSREHAAIVPRYLGVRVVLAKSFARIHRKNLINFGIVPIIINDEIYDKTKENDELTFDFSNLSKKQVTINEDLSIDIDLTDEEIEIIRKGAVLNCLK